MKKTISLLAILFITVNLFASAEVSMISGVWNRRVLPTGVKLYKIERGSIVEIASAMPDANKNFFFAFSPAKEGFYVIGDNPSVVNDYTFYFKPGDKLNVEVNKEGYKLVGDNTRENLEVEKWQQFVEPIEQMAFYFMGKNYTYVQFFPIFEEKLEALKTLKFNKTKNPIFDKAFAEKRNFDIYFYALQFIFTPHSAHPQDEDYPDFFNSISIKELTSSDAILNYPYGQSLIERAGMFNSRALSQKPTSYTDIILKESQNKILTGEIVLSNVKRVKTYPGFEVFEAEYGKYMATQDQVERLKNVGLDLRSQKPEGTKALNFKAQDINGKEVQYSDYTGKVIYIDVWATWCGPCKAEIPDLKKLTADYAGKDIIFMSVSTDKVADLEKWRTMVKSEELKGVQLFAGAASQDLMKGYGINGIPRFILVDKNGIVINNNAPRPSSPEIRALLNSVLK